MIKQVKIGGRNCGKTMQMNRQQELEGMSDFEINKLIAGMFLECDYVFDDGKIELIGITTFLGGYGEPEEREVKYGEFAPCSNPNDIMPIAIENRFNMTPSSNGGYNVNYHASPNIHHYANHENLYRAICIVFILMMDGKS